MEGRYQRWIGVYEHAVPIEDWTGVTLLELVFIGIRRAVVQIGFRGKCCLQPCRIHGRGNRRHLLSLSSAPQLGQIEYVH